MKYLLLVVLVLLCSCNYKTCTSVCEPEIFLYQYGTLVKCSNSYNKVLLKHLYEYNKDQTYYTNYFFEQKLGPRFCLVIVSNAFKNNSCLQIEFNDPEYICITDLKMAFSDPELYNHVISNSAQCFIETAKKRLLQADSCFMDLFDGGIIKLNSENEYMFDDDTSLKYTWLTNIYQKLYWDSSYYIFKIKGSSK